MFVVCASACQVPVFCFEFTWPSRRVNKRLNLQVRRRLEHSTEHIGLDDGLTVVDKVETRGEATAGTCASLTEQSASFYSAVPE